MVLNIEGRNRQCDKYLPQFHVIVGIIASVVIPKFMMGWEWIRSGFFIKNSNHPRLVKSELVGEKRAY